MSDHHNISDVSRIAGIPRDLLRMWERRYGYPNPKRDGNGDRIYDDGQLQKLVVVRQLLEQGKRPGRLMQLDIAELRSMLRSPQKTQEVDGEKLISLLQSGAAEALHSWLNGLLLAQGLRGFIHNVVAPATRRVGEAWSRDRLAIHQEHLYTETMQRLVRQALANLSEEAEEPRVMLTTVPGEQHALGLLMVESLLRQGGANVTAFGTEMPFREIREAAVQHHAQVIGLSFSASFKCDDALVMLNGLRQMIPDDVEIWAGGAALMSIEEQPTGIKHIRDLHDLESALAGWRP